MPQELFARQVGGPSDERAWGWGWESCGTCWESVRDFYLRGYRYTSEKNKTKITHQQTQINMYVFKKTNGKCNDYLLS